MASMHVDPDGKTFSVNPARSVLNTLLAGGYPIDTACGGKAQCGRCLIRVRSASRPLSPRTAAERARLVALGADRTAPESRLACQTYARSDVEIEVVNLRTRDS